jgi:tRNA-(ms[2]io[6]A)-hydroxylase
MTETLTSHTADDRLESQQPTDLPAIELRWATTEEWTECIVGHMDRFLPDHAAAEKKASGMAMAMVSHYPDRRELVSAMVDLAIEELNHFRAVVALMQSRGIALGPDEKDPYVNALRSLIRHGRDAFFLDRLLIAGIVEARGAERFGLLAQHLPEGELRRFYQTITRSEVEHQDLFLRLARQYFDPDEVTPRLAELLDAEAGIAAALPIRPALH